ncbi:hypothetical protein KIL84_012059 [Mauremys mutica]|uniref:Endonuclease/exonuclease/phosphatase domain-containing protein n=1 Tax=Mauremys mutica TaxID=74926 RepID=A0A9D3XEA2_9SAUR|nr:hypothetical protein KIL84_012059 [Mauremys mutica]
MLQETHIGNDQQARCYRIYGYNLMTSHHHPKYGLAIYIKDTITDFNVTPPTEEETTFTTTNKIGELHITNVYTAPSTRWPKPALPSTTIPCIYAGDFNCHHTMWGYKTNETDSEDLMDWISAQDLQLI